MRRRGPRCVHDEGSRIRTFEAQSHGFGTGCLRFAGRVAPTPRKTRVRLWARLFRTGLTTRRVPSKGFTMYPILILLSQAFVAQGHNTDLFTDRLELSIVSPELHATGVPCDSLLGLLWR